MASFALAAEATVRAVGMARSLLSSSIEADGFEALLPVNSIFNCLEYWRNVESTTSTPQVNVVNSTYFGLLAEFGEANIPLERVAPKYFGLSFPEARRRAPTKLLPCRTFRLGGQKSPWLVSATDLAELIDVRRAKAG